MIDDQIEINADIEKRLTKLETTVNKSNFSTGLSANEALLIKKLIEEQEKRVVHCEKVLNGKFGRFQRLNALNSIKLLKKILSEGR